MKSCKFCIHYPPTKRGLTAWNKRFSLNSYWAGKHFRARAQDARDIHSLTYLAMRQARIKKEVFPGPVEIIFRWDDRLDCSNHAALGKMIEDALKEYPVIKDDSRKWVQRVTHEFWDAGKIGVEVREIGADRSD